MRRRKGSPSGSLLELWRPPSEAGDAVGCLTSTFTFQPELFDEQCLARFLEVESDPDREDLAFLLERESRLGAVYAGVLVDHTQSGVAHSLRWDVLPVRLPSGKQHAKLSLLAWSNHVRIIVASANLTEAGYRVNQEVCLALDCQPDASPNDIAWEAMEFLRRLLAFIPGAGANDSAVNRAVAFLNDVEHRISQWKPAKYKRGIRQRLVFTIPSRDENPATGGDGFPESSSITEAVASCQQAGGAPEEVWVASPFFDICSNPDPTTTSLCKSMARGTQRAVWFCVPAIGDTEDGVVRLAAPESLIDTAKRYGASSTVEVLPTQDEDKNARPWHAKMIQLERRTGNGYSALLIGSSNFTLRGMGVGSGKISNRWNAEANLLTIATHRGHSRDPGRLHQIWPDMLAVESPSEVQWVGSRPELDEEERADQIPLHPAFHSATFCAGELREIVVRLNPTALPTEWSIVSTGTSESALLTAADWDERGRQATTTLAWAPQLPPETLRVRWTSGDGEHREAVLPLNVDDVQQLPPPLELAEMSADEMLLIIAAADPGAAFRAWARKRGTQDIFDDELDAADPPDLDPLRRYDLRTTFLRRVRSRARVLAQLRNNLERPVWGAQALQWKLEGFIGIRPLSERLLSDFAEADGKSDEALLTLADLIILLREVDYQPPGGALSRVEYDAVYVPFLTHLVTDIAEQVQNHHERVSPEVLGFWDRVVERCRN